MGTVSSVSKENNYNKISDSQDESSEYVFKISSNNKYLTQSETRDSTKETVINEPKIQYKFEWKDGGNEVKITGSFLNNWKTKEKMKKNLTTGIYEITLSIPKGIHQFKFIVDDRWVCSQHYKITKDKDNNANNVIDLTDYTPPQAVEDNDSTTKKKKKKSGKDVEYNCNYPNANEINIEAPGIPNHYFPHFNLNLQTYQPSLENFFRNEFIFNKSKTILETNTLKTILTISHEKLSHICFNNEKNENSNEKYIRTAITQRNKHKFITIIYFSPKE